MLNHLPPFGVSPKSLTTRVRQTRKSVSRFADGPESASSVCRVQRPQRVILIQQCLSGEIDGRIIRRASPGRQRQIVQMQKKNLAASDLTCHATACPGERIAARRCVPLIRRPKTRQKNRQQEMAGGFGFSAAIGFASWNRRHHLRHRRRRDVACERRPVPTRCLH